MQLASLEPGVTILPEARLSSTRCFTVSILVRATHRVYCGRREHQTTSTPAEHFLHELLAGDCAGFHCHRQFRYLDAHSGRRSHQHHHAFRHHVLHAAPTSFYRDHNMAAYPNLVRDPPIRVRFLSPNPGVWLGGPIKKDKLFFFFNYEFTNQVQGDPDLQHHAILCTLNHEYPSRISLRHSAARWTTTSIPRTRCLSATLTTGTTAFRSLWNLAILPTGSQHKLGGPKHHRHNHGLHAGACQ